MNEIVLSNIKTEYQSLIEEVENLRLVIAALSAEKDDLELHVCREIQAEYDMKVGNLEYEIMSYNLEIERLRLVIRDIFLQKKPLNTAHLYLRRCTRAEERALQTPGRYETSLRLP